MLINILFLGLFFFTYVSIAYSTAMDDYVWKEDPNFSYFDTGVVLHGKGYKGHVLNMTSQRWLTDEDTTRSIWWHFFVIIIPDNYDSTHPNNGTLWITDGSNDNPDEIPTIENYNMVIASELAKGTGLITGCLFQIPNEKMVFSSDPEQKNRGEDSIIAFTWAHFLDHPDEPEWLVRLPMVKASLRAMDVMTEYVAKRLRIPNLDYYCVTGASKRGWVTWDVAAMDYQSGRVQAISPIVLDAINFVEVLHHQFRSYGGWTYFLGDYYDQNITARLDDPNMVKLQQIEDPYFYKERLTLPKLIVNSGGDEFQQPDDTHYWWSEMPEPKHFLMMPNSDHSCATGIAEVIPAIATFFTYLVKGLEIPKATWVINNVTGDISANIESKSNLKYQAHMWYAKTCNLDNIDSGLPQRRDYRMLNLDNPCKCGIQQDDDTCINLQAFHWSKKELTQQEDGSYIAHMDVDVDGKYTAFFIDFTFDNEEQNIYFNRANTPKFNGNNGIEYEGKVGDWPYDKPGHLDFTTEVSIVPNTFPYAACQGVDCYGTLL